MALFQLEGSFQMKKRNLSVSDLVRRGPDALRKLLFKLLSLLLMESSGPLDYHVTSFVASTAL